MVRYLVRFVCSQLACSLRRAKRPRQILLDQRAPHPPLPKPVPFSWDSGDCNSHCTSTVQQVQHQLDNTSARRRRPTLPTMVGFVQKTNLAIARSFVGRYFRLDGSGHVR